MSQVALFSYSTGSGFQCAVEYNQKLFVGNQTSILLLDPFTGAVLDSKSYSNTIRGSLGFVSAGRITSTGIFVTSLGTLIVVDLTASTIQDTVLGGTADVDGAGKYLAFFGGKIYVLSYDPLSTNLSAWVRFPVDPGSPSATTVIGPDNILYLDSSPLAVVGDVIYLPGGTGIGLTGYMYTYTISSNTLAKIARPVFSRTGYTSTLVGSTLVVGGARLLKDAYAWDTGTNTETATALLEPSAADNGLVASTTDGTNVYMLNYANASGAPFLWTVNPTTLGATRVALSASLTARPVAMTYDASYIYVSYSSQKTLVWSLIPISPTVPPLSQEVIPQQYQNVHLQSGKRIVPYSMGAVVPPAIPPIPARTIENIKLPNGPKDYRYCRHPVLPYRNVPEPASYPNNPGQRRVCLVEGERPSGESGTPLQTYIPGRGVVDVAVNRSKGSRVAATWPPAY